MSKNDVMELPDEKLVLEILSEIGLNKERVKEAVAALNEWLDLQPHLPKEKDDRRMERWILRCKNSLEKTKQVLDLYYTLRGISPEFMMDCDPKSKWFDDYYKSSYMYPVRKITPEGDRITVFGITNSDTTYFDPLWMGKMGLMFLEVRTCEDYWRSDVLIMDLSGATVQHIAKFTLPFIKKYEVLIMRGYNFRLKAVHLLNMPPFAEIAVNLIKSVLKPKIAARFHTYSSNSEIYKNVPKEFLPTEYGGTDGSIAENTGRWRKKLESYRDWFLQQEKLQSDETKRPGKSIDRDELFGFEGSFRKLNLD